MRHVDYALCCLLMLMPYFTLFSRADAAAFAAMIAARYAAAADALMPAPPAATRCHLRHAADYTLRCCAYCLRAFAIDI